MLYVVIIVGGGLAGLSAAEETLRLHPKASVCVLEARNRLGGRTNSLAKEGVDVGAQWIGPAHSHLLDLVKRFNLKLCEQFYGPAGSTRLTECVGYDLTPLRPSDAQELQTYMDTIDQWSKTVNLDKPWTHEHASQWDNMNVEKHIKSTLISTYAQHEALLFCQTVLAAPPSQISFLFFLFYLKSSGGVEALGDGEQGAQRWRVQCGIQQISELLAESLVSRGNLTIRYSFAVRKCDLDEDENNQFKVVAIENVHSGEQERTFRTRSVIWAISPQLFSHRVSLSERLLQRDPLLARKIETGHRMVSGQAVKIIMAFKRAFWLENQNIKQSCRAAAARPHFTEIGPMHNLFHSQLKDGTPALVGLITGEEAIRFAKMLNDKARRELVVKQIQTMYCEQDNNTTQQPSEPCFYAEKLWGLEEYSMGCFAGIFPPNGSFVELGPIMRLSALNGRFQFCSTEMATEFYGYMEGALRSGKDAARGLSVQALDD